MIILRALFLFLFLFMVSSVVLSQDHRWTVKLSDRSTIDGLNLSGIDLDSLRVTSFDSVQSLSLADIVEIRKTRHVNLASYIIVGAFTGIPIGIIARATDASARVKAVSPLPYFGEGALIGTAGGLLLAWLSSADDVYTFTHEGKAEKGYFLRSIVDDEIDKRETGKKEDSIAVQRGLNPKKYWITVDYGIGFFFHSEDGWSPRSSIRLGFGAGSSQNLMFCAHLDYAVNSLGEEGWTTSLVPSSAKRYDLALYGGWILLKVVEAGAGVYYRTSDQVTEYYLGKRVGPWGPSGTADIRFYYAIGIGYQIALSDQVMLPFGLYFRNSAYGDNGSPVFFRIGLGYRF